MKPSRLWRCVALAGAMLFAFSDYLGAVTFCNMDLAGGEKARKAQEKSARAAANFFQAASTTFQMFGQIELHLAGDKDALRRASGLSGQSREQLSRVLKELEGLSSETEAIKAVDEALRRLADYSIALKEAKVAPGSPIATSVIEALKRGSIGLLQVCSESIKDLQDPDRAMGKVFRAVEIGKLPVPQDVWDAIVQWNETLIRGRLISAIFTVRR